jgi:hypothetical protein
MFISRPPGWGGAVYRFTRRSAFAKALLRCHELVALAATFGAPFSLIEMGAAKRVATRQRASLDAE